MTVILKPFFIFCLLSSLLLPNKTFCQYPLKEFMSVNTDTYANDQFFSGDGNYFIVLLFGPHTVYKKMAGGYEKTESIKGCGLYNDLNGSFTTNGSFLAIANADKSICIYKNTPVGFKSMQKFSINAPNESYAATVKFYNDQTLVVAGPDQAIRFYELSGEQFTMTKKFDYPGGKNIRVGAFSPNGKLLATIDDDDRLFCWKLDSSGAKCGSEYLNCSKYIGVFAITNNYLLVSGTRDSLNLYTVSPDLGSYKLNHKFPKSEKGYSAVNFNTAGNSLIVAEEKGPIQLFGLQNNAPKLLNVSDPLPDADFNSCAFSPDGNTVAATSSGGKILKMLVPDKSQTGKLTAKAKQPGKASEKNIANNTVVKKTINPLESKPSATEKTVVEDPTQFVEMMNGFMVFKEKNSLMYGLKENGKIVFPAVLTSIEQDIGGTFSCNMAGYHLERAAFGFGSFNGDLQCDVCDGSGLVPKNYRFKGTSKTETEERYLGQGVYMKISVIKTTPPTNVTVDTKCMRCDGLGNLKGGFKFLNNTVSVWTYKDEMQKKYKN